MGKRILSLKGLATGLAGEVGRARQTSLRMAKYAMWVMGVQAWNQIHAEEWGWNNVPSWQKYLGTTILLPPKLDANGEPFRDANGQIRANVITIVPLSRDYVGIGAPIVYAYDKLFGEVLPGLAKAGELERADISQLLNRISNDWAIGGAFAGGNEMTNWIDNVPLASEVNEILQGENAFYDEDIIPTHQRRRYDAETGEIIQTPLEEEYRRNTSPTAMFFSELFRRDDHILGKLIDSPSLESPQRLDHLLHRVPAGAQALEFTDFISQIALQIHASEATKAQMTAEDQVAHWRSLGTSAERNMYRISIRNEYGPKGEQEFLKLLNKPRTDFLKIPFFNDIVQKWAPTAPEVGIPISDRAREEAYGPLNMLMPGKEGVTGGARELITGKREEYLESLPETKGRDAKTIEKATKEITAFLDDQRDEQFAKQRELDEQLHTYVKDPLSAKKSTALNPREWVAKSNDLGGEYRVVKEALPDFYASQDMDGNTITIFDLPEDKQDELYQQQFKVIGNGIQSKDQEVMAKWLYAGYKSINYPDIQGDPEAQAEAEHRYYRAQENYLDEVRKTYGEEMYEKLAGRDGLLHMWRTEYPSEEIESGKLTIGKFGMKDYKQAQIVMGDYFQLRDNPEVFLKNRNPATREADIQDWLTHTSKTSTGRTQDKEGSQHIKTLYAYLRKEQHDLVLKTVIPGTLTASGEDESDIDYLLAFWHGDWYQPITPAGKRIKQQLYLQSVSFNEVLPPVMTLPPMGGMGTQSPGVMGGMGVQPPPVTAPVNAPAAMPMPQLPNIQLR